MDVARLIIRIKEVGPPPSHMISLRASLTAWRRRCLCHRCSPHSSLWLPKGHLVADRPVTDDISIIREALAASGYVEDPDWADVIPALDRVAARLADKDATIEQREIGMREQMERAERAEQERDLLRQNVIDCGERSRNLADKLLVTERDRADGIRDAIEGTRQANLRAEAAEARNRELVTLVRAAGA